MSEGWCTCTRNYGPGDPYDTTGCPVHDRPDRWAEPPPVDPKDKRRKRFEQKNRKRRHEH